MSMPPPSWARPISLSPEAVGPHSMEHHAAGEAVKVRAVLAALEWRIGAVRAEIERRGRP